MLRRFSAMVVLLSCAACARAAPPPLRVLFIGNSQLAAEDVPRMVEKLSESAPDDAPRIEASRAIVDGASLKRCWDAGEGEGSPRAMIASEKWDWVVIQEIFYGDAKEFEEYAARFDDEIRKAGSRTILFATANVSEFYQKGYEYPGSFKKLNDMQIAFGRKRNIPVAAAGYAWMKYLGPGPSQIARLELYAEDKGHPGIKGSYIYACLLYARIAGRDPQLLPLPEKDEDFGNGRIIAREELVRMRAAAWAQHLENAETGGEGASQSKSPGKRMRGR